MIRKSRLILVLSLFALVSCHCCESSETTTKSSFDQFDFDAKIFQHPDLIFGPMARWWWPGNDVDSIELVHEINLFASHGFAGVEIQVLSPLLPKTLMSNSKTVGWDTPEFYRNLKIVMEEAEQKGLVVDLNNGSGWPAGGPYIKPEDGILTLVYAQTDVVGGSQVSLRLPYKNNPTSVSAKLVAVVASKVIEGNDAEHSESIQLDANSTIVLTDEVRNDSLTWEFSEGKWKLIAFWQRPQSNLGTMVAAREQGPVLNYFDTTVVENSYEYLFGDRTGLPKYYSKPLRAIFNDSYEFSVDRFFSSEFIEYFKKYRGYDITPWLAANMADEYNFVSYKNPNNPPAFCYSNEDWRLRYDYDLTISELFGLRFLGASTKWLKERGMLHRSQVYGLTMDMIGNASFVSMPESESMLASELNLKVLSAGAHLHNKPLLSAESVVFMNRAYMTTPEKIRLAVDKLFTSGVNQVIYHGIPYKYVNNETTEVGWHPFNLGYIDFSSHLGEGTQFWKYQKEVNDYIARTQYAMRAGKPHADVLIYFPYMNVEGMPDNPTEIMTKGYLPDVEPELRNNGVLRLDPKKEQWANQIYPVINQLERNGITWEWVNDASIQVATLDHNKNINIRGNCYQALMLVGIDVIQLNTAKRIEQLACEGMKFVVVGDLPSKQPSFLNWEKNDKITSQLINKASQKSNSKCFSANTDIRNWIGDLDKTIRFKYKYDFTRQVEREMIDGSRIHLIWNKSAEWQPISLILDKKFRKSYWLDAENGHIETTDGGTEVNYVVPPYKTVILYVSTEKEIPNEVLSAPIPTIYDASPVQAINKWSVKIDTILINDTSLFDWKDDERLRYTSAPGIYRAGFTIDRLDKESHYFIDLGKVCFTADVLLNGKSVGSVIFSPYTIDITDCIQEGENLIEVHITSGQLNGFIGEAEKGNPRYAKFKGRANGVMSGGLVGPVVIRKGR